MEKDYYTSFMMCLLILGSEQIRKMYKIMDKNDRQSKEKILTYLTKSNFLITI